MRGIIFGLMALASAASAAAAMQAPTPSAPADVAAPTPPAPPYRQIISNPDWLMLPAGDQLARLYPPAARAKRLAGRTRMSCVVQADGSLSGCSIVMECPAGLGFGQATLKTAPYFQMRPKTINGVPVSGGRVIIPLTWQVAGGPGPTCGPNGEALAAPGATQQAPAVGGAAEAANPPPGEPSWERTPSADEFDSVYPRSAKDKSIEGKAVVRCKATKEGTLRDCVIIEESPAGWGFGEAALKAAQYFKLRPTTSTGVSVEGGSIVVPINWRLVP